MTHEHNMPSLTELIMKTARDTAPEGASETDIRRMANKVFKQLIDDDLFECVGYSDDGSPIYSRTELRRSAN